MLLFRTNIRIRARTLHNTRAGAEHVEEPKSDSTELCLPDSAHARLCAMIGARTPLWQPATMARALSVA